MKWFIGILLLLAVGAAFPAIMNRMRGSAQPATRSKNLTKGITERKHYKATSIVPGNDCCQAVAEIAETRFLADKIMRLPVEACDRIERCDCTFQHHADRRDSDDRRNPVGSLSTDGHIGMKRRNRRGAEERRDDFDDSADDF